MLQDVYLGGGSSSHQDHFGGTPEPMTSPIPPPFFMNPIWCNSLQTEPCPDEPVLDRALAASRNHREAEKRRRERIKSHLDRLRSVLSCDPKIDKASLLAKAVERMRDLKQHMAGIAETRLLPTETDEIVVLTSSSTTSIIGGSTGHNKPPIIFEASLCCDDRSDLLPELTETLRALRLKTLRAEMATLGGRVRNVLVLARERGEHNGNGDGDEDVDMLGEELLRNALRALIDRPAIADRPKRKRVVGMELA